ncbi:hybrid sensor histidine kinase/response regulator [Reticulibacter mediterranei]|uniref:histidine kinase n=1 Tax=Reticulibacter mediterranei TaxID=2778369 RepID=A0A8J3N5F7_9CHLR|nr:hybrid sensor histidine kinase/response regulator [Reticulibacter mediterranei]GHO95117.1 hybrid sensor histidine kinase/response regulator [Reticulibacter mediterranei]
MTGTPYILVVDDDPALLRALPQTLYLRIKEIKIDTCDSAQKALELARQYDYDAIISDIKMPGMDGLALLKELREIRSETPVLLITGHGEHDLAIQALRGGAYDYILKPVDRDTLVAALLRAIHAHQLQRRVTEQHIALSMHANVLEQQVQKRTAELEAANATKEKFMKIVAHELKAPLENLKGMTQLLQRQLDAEVPGDVLKQGLADMEHSVERTETLVQDLLDSSLMDTNMFVLRRAPHDLVDLCHHLLDEYTLGVGPAFTCEFRGDLVEAEVDADRLRQVIVSLLGNAQKEAPKGSPITITLQQSGYEAIISIRDVGDGLPPDFVTQISEQLSRMPDVKAYGPHAGLGLGLYVARKIVERHGGHIDVQSTQGQGSLFSIHLPLYVDANKTQIDAQTLEMHTQAVWTLIH